jgi:hypothetical protein
VPSSPTPGPHSCPRAEEPPGPSRRLRRARAGTGAAFLLTGLVFATWAARIPSRKAELGLTDGQLAVAFVGLNAGAVLGLQAGAVVVTRLGSRRTLLVGLPSFASMLLLLAEAPGLPTLTLALAGSALLNSVVDVAINDQGVGVQQAYARSLLSGMHALHSLGGVVGGALAWGAVHLGLGVTSHFALVVAGVVVAAAIANRGLLPPEDLHRDHGPARSAPLLGGWTGTLLVLGAAAFVFTLAEGSALDWSAVVLSDARGAGPAVAAAGLGVFSAALALGRLVGDRLIDRLGPVRVFAAGTLLAGGGFGVGLLEGSLPGAVLGLALLGLGLATLLPLSISAAGTSSRLPVPVAVARVSTLGYLGSFTGPALIGLVASRSSLVTALLLPAAALIVAVAAAPALRRRPLHPDDGGTAPDRRR